MLDDKNRAEPSEDENSARGERLISVRLRAGLTQNNIAEKVGVSRQHISNIETEMTSPTVRVLRDYLQACGTDFAEFFYGPLPVNQTPQQREYHRKLQVLLEDTATCPVITRVLDSLMTSLETSAKALVQPVRVQTREIRVPSTKKGRQPK
jgi:transcriptional regulator with XRE-family HTH domain